MMVKVFVKTSGHLLPVCEIFIFVYCFKRLSSDAD